MSMNVFNELESRVRSYSRVFPAVFDQARGAVLEDTEGIEYLDFFSGAGTLNYGHNNPVLKAQLLDYIAGDRIVHGLDMATTAKRVFLETLRDRILGPRGMDYRVQFPGPTGTNAVECALKIARKATGRNNVIAFTNGFHGVSLGSLAMTANSHYRGASGVEPAGGTFMPYDGYLGEDTDTTEYLDRVLTDGSSGVDDPAAVILETVQGEGGVNVASYDWLRNVEAVCRKHNVLLIVDDIQVGCGRTGPFFSFEEAGIAPDIITLSKSLSGFGLPFSLVLLRPDLDQWKPGEHNGTFRGNNLAFCTAAAALQEYWRDDRLSREVQRKGAVVRARLERIARQDWAGPLTVRGRGMIQGLVCAAGEQARAISSAAFANGLVIETAGSEDQVLKCLAPLTITNEELVRGLDVLEDAARAVLEPAPATAEVRS